MGKGVPPLGRMTSFNPLVNFFPTRDDRWICLALLQADRWWPDLCCHLGREDLIHDARFSTAAARVEHRTELITVLDAVFRGRTLQDWREALTTLQGAWAPVLNALEISQDPQLLANGLLPEVDGGDGNTYQIVASPSQFDEAHIGPLRRAPEAGEHTEEILLSLGLGWEKIATLKNQKVVT